MCVSLMMKNQTSFDGMLFGSTGYSIEINATVKPIVSLSQVPYIYLKSTALTLFSSGCVSCITNEIQRENRGYCSSRLFLSPSLLFVCCCCLSPSPSSLPQLHFGSRHEEEQEIIRLQ